MFRLCRRSCLLRPPRFQGRATPNPNPNPNRYFFSPHRLWNEIQKINSEVKCIKDRLNKLEVTVEDVKNPSVSNKLKSIAATKSIEESAVYAGSTALMFLVSLVGLELTTEVRKKLLESMKEIDWREMEDYANMELNY